MNLWAVGVVAGLYGLILLVGLLAGRYFRTKDDDTGELASIAGRNLGALVGILTMAATSVGGGYLAGTTEGVATQGLAWTIFPVTIALAFIIGSLLFAGTLRRRRYLTLMDPLQERYGDVMTGLLLLVALFAEILWGASILITLGRCIMQIADFDEKTWALDEEAWYFEWKTWVTVASATVALLYTMLGQMAAVAYTDILQLILVLVGMVLCTPFAMTHTAVDFAGAITLNITDTWLGTVPTDKLPLYCDYWLTQTLGGIPWNTYVMRLLAARSAGGARVASAAGGALSLAFAVPPALLGLTALSTDWSKTNATSDPLQGNDPAAIFPTVIRFLTPEPVAIVALAAVAAAAMSSLDSIILSSSSMFSHNIYKAVFRQTAGLREMRFVQIMAMLVVTAVSTYVAITSNTVYAIFLLTADAVYTVLFPQFLCAVFIIKCNAYGSLLGFVVGAVLRLGGGVPELGIPAFILYPWYDADNETQLFPFKTLAMVSAFVSIVAASYFARSCFLGIPLHWDITGTVVQVPSINKFIEERNGMPESELEEINDAYASRGYSLATTNC